MRKTHADPTLIDPPLPEGEHTRIDKYRRISEFLDQLPEWAGEVARCLRNGTSGRKKRSRGEHFSAYVGWVDLRCNLTQLARNA